MLSIPLNDVTNPTAFQDRIVWFADIDLARRRQESGTSSVPLFAFNWAIPESDWEQVLEISMWIGSQS